MDTQEKIKVMIIGDFLIFRNGLKLLLETEKNIKVVGEAADLSEASDSIPKTSGLVLGIESEASDKSAASPTTFNIFFPFQAVNFKPFRKN